MLRLMEGKRRHGWEKGYHVGGFLWGLQCLNVGLSSKSKSGWISHSFGGEDVLTTCLACAYSLRLQGCEIYALVKRANLVVS